MASTHSMSTEEEATIQIISRQNNTGRRQNTWARNMFGNSGFISLYWQGGRVMEKKKKTTMQIIHIC